MKPEQLLEYLGNLADAHTGFDIVFKVPTVPYEGTSYYSFLVGVSAQDVRDFVDWVKPLKYVDRREIYLAKNRMKTAAKQNA